MTPSLLARVRQALQARYAVLDQLGRGGMAIVFRAYDRTLQRDVAIKVLDPALATARGAERFVREARLIARLVHPNVVPVHEAGESDGLFYYVMDLVDGETLENRLHRGPLPRQQAVSIVRDILAALEAAHAKGVVHRDVKPSNVFLSGHRALLGDFGIAAARQRTEDALTYPGERIGTPAYMAPEQSRGEAGPASDVYAAAMLFYEAITAKRWEPGAEPRKVALPLPRPMASAVRRALDPEASRRWPSADLFRSALVEPAPKPPRRWTAAVAVVLVVGAGVALLFRGRSGSRSTHDDLALLPCAPELAGDDVSPETLENIGRLASSMLRDLPTPRLASYDRSASWWRARPEHDIADAARALNAAVVAECLVTPAGDDSLAVTLRLYDREGTQLPSPPTLLGAAGPAPHALAEGTAVALLQGLGSARSLASGGYAALSGHNPEAVRAFLRGEYEFNRNAMEGALGYFSNALEHDSTLVLAAWRLADAQRWAVGSAVKVDLDELHAHRADALGEVDRRMLEAAVAERGAVQFALYERLIADYPNAAYPLLLYGDELFHRGPLFGIGLDSALVVLERATRQDSSLGPAYDHLAWLQIRLGLPEAARRTLDHYTAISGDALRPRLLQQAYLERFAPVQAAQSREALLAPVPGNLAQIALVARFPMSFDLPRTQLEFGRRLVTAAGQDRGARISGYLAQGVAFMALGRPRAAIARFDSAAATAGSDEGRLVAAEWRVMPHALGAGWIPAEIEIEGRTALELLARDSSTTSDVRARSAWALALVAARDGDAAAAQRWANSLGNTLEAAPAAVLAVVAAGAAEAAAGDAVTALQLSATTLAYDSTAIESRPFLRTAVHMLRGEWLAGERRASAADAAWRWYENLDVEGTPGARLQAADVDWAFTAVARLRRARLALSIGSTTRACPLARDVLRYWADSEPTIEPLVAEAREIRDLACDGAS